MPEMKSTEIAAGVLVPAGDFYADPNKETRLVLVDSKTKYTTLHWQNLSSGETSTTRHPHGELVAVWREVPTPEEAHAHDLEYARNSLTEWMETTAHKWRAARNKFTDVLAEDSPVRVGNHLYSLLWTQAEYRILQRVQNLMESDGGLDILQTVANVATDLTSDLLNEQFASRSTSVLSNAVDDIDREVIARWLRRFSVRDAVRLTKEI